MNGTRRADIERGVRVAIVQKQDQRTGRLTEGVVRDILTKSATHPHGIKVRLETGEVGRVKQVCGYTSCAGRALIASHLKAAGHHQRDAGEVLGFV